MFRFSSGNTGPVYQVHQIMLNGLVLIEDSLHALAQFGKRRFRSST